MRLKLSMIFFVLLCAAATQCFAQFKTTIPLNEHVVAGELENGMHYYTLHNEADLVNGPASILFKT